jgi:hypothetical protein
MKIRSKINRFKSVIKYFNFLINLLFNINVENLRDSNKFKLLKFDITYTIFISD